MSGKEIVLRGVLFIFYLVLVHITCTLELHV
jgi:hypothetical protein